MSGDYGKLADILKTDLQYVTDPLVREGITSMINLAEKNNITVHSYERPLSAKLIFACTYSSSFPTIKFFAQALIDHCKTTADPTSYIDCGTINDECWYYTYEGQGNGPVWYTLSNRTLQVDAKLEILRYLVEAGFYIDQYQYATCMTGDKGSLPILKYLVENGAHIDWSTDDECCNLYKDTDDLECRKYLKIIGKTQGVTAEEFRELDMLRAAGL